MRKNEYNRDSWDWRRALLQIILALLVPGGLIMYLIGSLGSNPHKKQCEQWSSSAQKAAQLVPHWNGASSLDSNNYRIVKDRILMNTDTPQEQPNWSEYLTNLGKEQNKKLIEYIKDSISGEVNMGLLNKFLAEGYARGMDINQKRGVNYLLIPNFDITIDKDKCSFSIDYKVYTPKTYIIYQDALTKILRPDGQQCSSLNSFMTNPIGKIYNPIEISTCINETADFCSVLKNLSSDDKSFLQLVNQYQPWINRCNEGKTFFETGSIKISKVSKTDIAIFTEVVFFYVKSYPDSKYQITCLGYADEEPVTGIAYQDKGRYLENNRSLPLHTRSRGIPIGEKIKDNYQLSWARAFEGIQACYDQLAERFPIQLRENISFQYRGKGVDRSNNNNAVQRRIEFSFTKLNY